MKILHLWDICDNSAYITEKLIIMGHKSKVVSRKNYRRKGLIKYYLRVIYHLLTFKADIVHINAWDKGIVLAKMFSKAKILMHYHGSDIRGKSLPKSIRFVDLIGFSTRDLVGEHILKGMLLPVIVPDWFEYKGGRKKGTILYLDQDNRTIPYEQMPFVLSKYEFYRDKKRMDNITNRRILSKTGMEAIKCGTKVIVDTGEIVESFPMTTIDDYIKVYEDLIRIES